MKWIKQKVIGFLGRSKDEQREKKTTHPARDSCNPRSNDRETNANSSELRVDIRLRSIASNLDRSHDAHRGQSRFFFAPRCRLSPPHGARRSHTHISQCARERKKKAERSRKTNARTTHRAYLCHSRTWKKPRFQPKTQFSWLSLTFSRFARKNVTDVVTTAAVFRVALVEERATTIMGFFTTDHETKRGWVVVPQKKQKGKAQKGARASLFFFSSLVSSFIFSLLGLLFWEKWSSSSSSVLLSFCHQLEKGPSSSSTKALKTPPLSLSPPLLLLLPLSLSLSLSLWR